VNSLPSLAKYRGSAVAAALAIEKIAIGILGVTEIVTCRVHQFRESLTDLTHGKSLIKFSSCFGFIRANGSFKTKFDSPAINWAVIKDF
jgi:hypothetical protein